MRLTASHVNLFYRPSGCERRLYLDGLVWNKPLFTSVVVLTLALGIGANTVVFTVVNGVLLSPLPYAEPDRLVRLYSFNVDRAERGLTFVVGPGFTAYRELADVFDGLATAFTYGQVGADLVAEGEPRRILRMPISAGFFETLGVALTLGREFRRDEEDGERLVVLSHGLWRSAFHADPEAIGRTMWSAGLRSAKKGTS